MKPTPPLLRSSCGWACVHDAVRVKPMLASPAGTGGLPLGTGWSYEVKWDGFRAMARSERGRLRLDSRSGLQLLDRFPGLAGLHDVTADGTVLDGEVVALVDGVPSFEAVADSARHAGAQLVYVVFDVPVHAGADLTGRPLTRRREVLGGLDLPACAIGSQVFIDGAALLEVTRERGLEGVVAKRDASPYRPGVRSPDWVKLAHRRSRTALVGGWRADVASSTRVASLLLGARDGSGALRYLGRAGSGLSAALATRAAAALLEHPAEASPFAAAVPAAARTGVRWCAPEVVVQVAYRERTTAGVLRHPVVLGLRDDVGPDPWDQP